MDEPPIRLKDATNSAGIKKDQFFVMQHGETKILNLWVYNEHFKKLLSLVTLFWEID